ncbi:MULTISPECIES: tetratricopeptide repeat protein [Microbulbifer]|uniref:tetratricopeptide repeat protein n=1 Tax=Microbulbifer TaxID=48073 RepID=UPI001E3488D5|nr:MULTISPECIES: tetratricopeptide repeat protein [Microbulbifer]UHQ56573.1 tetratricopeptide repeat protein [Microbulbifer sp. YPW16]
MRNLPVNMLARTACVALMLLLGACAGGPAKTGKVTDYSKVRVAGGVSKDFEESLQYLNAGEYQQAIELLNEVIEREQRLPAPYVNLGIAYYKTGDQKHAEESFLKALELDPGHAAANNELAVLYRKQGRFEEARTIYTNAISSNPEYSPLVKNLGILCDLYLQDLQCALAQFNQYLQLNPDDQQVTIWMADLKRRAGR